MKLAERMSRIGTESAFDVLVRARALEAQGKDIIPIPGTKRRKYLEENIAAVDIVLSETEVQELSAAFPAGVTAGSRYPAPHMPRVNA